MTRSSALLLATALLSACTTCEMTYKAVSKDIPCDLDPDRTVFVDNPSMGMYLSAQSRQFITDQGGGGDYTFSESAKRKGAALTRTVLGNFREHLAGDLKARLGPVAAAPRACYLSVSPQSVVYDQGSQFTIELKATVIAVDSGNAVLSNKIRVATGTRNERKVVGFYADKVVQELRKDGFFATR